jgi:AraC-like DNA-binding protein
MKILPFKIAQPVNESFWIQNDHLSHLYDILHQHDEFQITLIQESTGNAIAGNRICEFSPGDIFVFGSRFPHAFRNEPAYYNPENHLRARALSVYFEWNVMGSAFWALPETRQLLDLSQKAEQGIFFPASLNRSIAAKIEELAAATETERLILLLTVLKQLATAEHYEVLSTGGAYNNLNETDEMRLDAIYRFTLKEYYRPISLQEIADVAHMTTNSFCRYFKTRTRKSYLDFLTEFRIGQACKLLQQEQYSIADIAIQVGFNNLSNFNRKFKELNDCTPKAYRNKLRHNTTN